MNFRYLVPEFFLALHICIKFAHSLKCFHCNTDDNPSCGIYFKPYQFKAIECGDEQFKCGLQREPPKKDGWVPIMRACYRCGSLPELNETNGCRNFSYPMGGKIFTAQMCFCDTDFCNHSYQIISWRTTLAILCIAHLILR